MYGTGLGNAVGVWGFLPLKDILFPLGCCRRSGLQQLPQLLSLLFEVRLHRLGTALGRGGAVQGDFELVRGAGDAHRDPHLAGVRRLLDVGLPLLGALCFFGLQGLFQPELDGVVHGVVEPVGAVQLEGQGVVVHCHGGNGEDAVFPGQGVGQGPKRQVLQGLGIGVLGQGLQGGVAREFALGQGEIHHGLGLGGLGSALGVQGHGADHIQLGGAVHVLVRQLGLAKVLPFPEQGFELDGPRLGLGLQHGPAPLRRQHKGTRRRTSSGLQPQLRPFQPVAAGEQNALGACGPERPVDHLVGKKRQPVIPGGFGFRFAAGGQGRFAYLPHGPIQEVLEFHPAAGGAQVQKQRGGAAPIQGVFQGAGQPHVGLAHAEGADRHLGVGALQLEFGAQLFQGPSGAVQQGPGFLDAQSSRNAGAVHSGLGGRCPGREVLVDFDGAGYLAAGLLDGAEAAPGQGRLQRQMDVELGRALGGFEIADGGRSVGGIGGESNAEVGVGPCAGGSVVPGEGGVGLVQLPPGGGQFQGALVPAGCGDHPGALGQGASPGREVQPAAGLYGAGVWEPFRRQKFGERRDVQPVGGGFPGQVVGAGGAGGRQFPGSQGEGSGMQLQQVSFLLQDDAAGGGQGTPDASAPAGDFQVPFGLGLESGGAEVAAQGSFSQEALLGKGPFRFHPEGNAFQSDAVQVHLGVGAVGRLPKVKIVGTVGVPADFRPSVLHVDAFHHGAPVQQVPGVKLDVGPFQVKQGVCGVFGEHLRAPHPVQAQGDAGEVAPGIQVGSLHVQGDGQLFVHPGNGGLQPLGFVGVHPKGQAPGRQ